MIDPKLDELINQLVDYIIANSEKSKMKGVTRDYALIKTQEIFDRVSERLLLKFHEKEKLK
jgi:hypothetical protein